MENGTCPVCRYAKVGGHHNGDITEIDCTLCGWYKIVETACTMLSNRPISEGLGVANARGWMRENQGMLLRSEDLARIRTAKPPSVAERAERLLQIIAGPWPGVASLFSLSAGMGQSDTSHTLF